MSKLASSSGLILVLAHAAHAAPIAKLVEDIDGDQTADTLELDENGELVASTAKGLRHSVKVAPRAVEGRITLARVHNHPQLVVDVTAPPAREAVIVDIVKWRELGRFALGGVGLDREYSFEIATSATGIVRYQTRWDVKR